MGQLDRTLDHGVAVIGHVDRDQQVLVVHCASPWQGMESSMAQLAAGLCIS
ncbi:hypothetical protein D3C78_1516530 [compost metagenome]